LDLRNVEEFSNFGVTTFTYTPHNDFEPVDLTTHRGDPKQVIDLAKNSLESILKEALVDVGSKITDHRAIAHIYISCEGLDQDFIFNRAGPEKMTLRNLLKSNRNIDAVVDEFSRIIQSGKPVILDSNCTIRICVYEPPPGYVGSDDEEVAEEDRFIYEEMRTRHNNNILYK
jgi:hypothetical protein